MGYPPSPWSQLDQPPPPLGQPFAEVARIDGAPQNDLAGLRTNLAHRRTSRDTGAFVKESVNIDKTLCESSGIVRILGSDVVCQNSSGSLRRAHGFSWWHPLQGSWLKSLFGTLKIDLRERETGVEPGKSSLEIVQSIANKEFCVSCISF